MSTYTDDMPALATELQISNYRQLVAEIEAPEGFSRIAAGKFVSEDGLFQIEAFLAQPVGDLAERISGRRLVGVPNWLVRHVPTCVIAGYYVDIESTEGCISQLRQWAATYGVNLQSDKPEIFSQAEYFSAMELQTIRDQSDYRPASFVIPPLTTFFSAPLQAVV